ncbi:MAG: hypothetical protein FJZ11_03080 [Candidatus Omnitrophica bacterium]|nr:hypothetical protein [Candidatus Omnitrophota bacterium]
MAYIISLFKRTLFKLINFLLGKTKIFIFVLGWFLVITGSIFLIQPERARNKLIMIGFGFLKWYLLIIAIYLGMMMISFSEKTQLIGMKISTLAAVIAVIAAYFLLKKKTYNSLTEKFAKIPIGFLKIFACIQIAVGTLMLILEKRIW